MKIASELLRRRLTPSRVSRFAFAFLGPVILLWAPRAILSPPGYILPPLSP